jgi:hypothetical protein
MIVFRKLFKVFSKQQQQQQSDTHFLRVVKKVTTFLQKTHKKTRKINFLNKNNKHFLLTKIFLLFIYLFLFSQCENLPQKTPIATSKKFPMSFV